MEPNLKKAVELQRKGDLKGAVAVLRRAISSGVRFAQHYYFLAVLEEHMGDVESAYVSIGNAVQCDGKQADFWFSKGNICQKLGYEDEAVEALRRCVSLNSEHVQGLVNLALILQRRDELELGLDYTKQALRVAPTELKAWLAYIGTLGFLRRFDEGLLARDEALKIFADNAQVLHMGGNLELAAGRVDEAAESYRKALEFAPESVPVLVSMGDLIALHRNGRDAIPYLEKALGLDPECADAKHRLGTAYLTSGFPVDAVSLLLEVVQKNPANMDAFDGLLLASQYLDNADEGEIFELHRQWAQHNAQRFYPEDGLWLNERDSLHCKVGFVSPDFRNHSVTRFMTALLRNYREMEGVELICYSDVKRQDRFTGDLEKMGGEWVYSYCMTDEELYHRIQNDKVDVLIDLAGHTGNHRLLVFARKAARVQVSWLGYPNTTGLETVDYRFSDSVADPVGRSDELSSEKIVRLPGGFHCFEPPIVLPDIRPAPVLKNGFLTFGSFNNQAKINQLTLERWASILGQVPDSRLVLKNHQLSDPRNREHWLAAMKMVGIDVSRVELLGYSASLEEHYATYNRVDIGLDTFPYNGTTTTCEALWMGVPVLTIAGDSQRSRTGASLLTHAGLGDWVAESEREMVSLAMDWNLNREELNAIRLGLRELVVKSPIGDQRGFAKKFFEIVQGLHHDGL